MKYYVTPEMEVSKVTVCDVLTASGQLENRGVEDHEQVGKFGKLNRF